MNDIQKIDIVQRCFFDTAIADVLRAMDGGSLMGAFQLTLCAIDAAAYLRNEVPAVDRRIRENYEVFVSDYLTNLNGNYVPEEIWAFRCGLVHVYGYSSAMARINMAGFACVHLRPTRHLHRTGSMLTLNLESFVSDVICSCFHFFNNLKENVRTGRSSLEQFLDQAKDLLLVTRIIRMNRPAPVTELVSLPSMKPYAEMHRSLRELDDTDPLPKEDRLLADITAILTGE